MSEKDKNSILEEDVLENMQDEIEDFEKEEMENEKKIENKEEIEEDKTKEILSKTLADFDNYKKRVERDKKESYIFMKTDILKHMIPLADDLERIIKNTPDELKENALFEWVTSTLKRLNSEFEKLWVSSFDSIWKEVNPDFHDVMTVVPGQKSGIIFDEFEKGYMIDWKVLRHAKVIVWA